MTPQTNEEIRNLVLEEHGFSKTLPELLIIAMSYKDTRIHSLEAGVEELKKALDHWTLMHIQESARSAKLEANLKIAVGALEKISRADDENHYGEEGLALMVCVETSKSALFRLKSGGGA